MKGNNIGQIKYEYNLNDAKIEMLKSREELEEFENKNSKVLNQNRDNNPITGLHNWFVIKMKHDAMRNKYLALLHHYRFIEEIAHIDSFINK